MSRSKNLLEILWLCVITTRAQSIKTETISISQKRRFLFHRNGNADSAPIWQRKEQLLEINVWCQSYVSLRNSYLNPNTCCCDLYSTYVQGQTSSACTRRGMQQNSSTLSSSRISLFSASLTTNWSLTFNDLDGLVTCCCDLYSRCIQGQTSSACTRRGMQWNSSTLFSSRILLFIILFVFWG